MSAPRLVPVSHPRYAYRLEYWHDGKRKERYFKTKGEGEAELAKLKRSHDAEGTAGLVMDAQARADYFAAEALLREHGISVLTAVRRYVAANPVGNGTMKWDDAVEKFLHELESRKGRRPATIDNLSYRLTAFAKDYAPTAIRDIDREDIEEWIDRKGVSNTTRRNDFAALRNFLGWAVKRGHLAKSPCEGVESPITSTSTPRVLSLVETERLLDAAREYGMLRYYAIALFAGLRQSEILELTDSHISKTKILVHGIGKKHASVARTVPISPRLEKLLKETEDSPDSGKWHPTRHKLVVKTAGLVWQQDIMRHTFVSYRLAMTQNEHQTAQESGHAPEVAKRYYKNARPPEEADLYFGGRYAIYGHILPTTTLAENTSPTAKTPPPTADKSPEVPMAHTVVDSDVSRSESGTKPRTPKSTSKPKPANLDAVRMMPPSLAPKTP